MQQIKAYLDYNATTPVKPAVITRMAEIMEMPFNASSVHAIGREAHRLLENARNQVATVIGAPHSRVIFTASGTEANNLALRGVEKKYKRVISAIEHVSVMQAVDEADIIPVDANGHVQIEALEALLESSDAPCLVSVMLANNETGVIQDIKTMAELVHRYDGLMHSDISQAVGKIPLSLAELGVDMATLSAHKFGGPQGAAALIVAPCVTISAQIKGGGQELGARAGTQNLAAIIGMEVAISRVNENLTMAFKMQKFRDRLEKELCDYAQNAWICSRESERLPNTSAIMMPGVNSETQLIHYDLNGVAVSAGSACSSGKVGRSHVLEAMQLDEDKIDNVIRVSMGAATTESDIELFIALWKQLYDRAGNHAIADVA